MEIDLTGKLAIITGATGQLGRTMFRTLVSCGADVVACYLSNAAKADELVGQATSLGRRALAVQVDVTDIASVMSMRDMVNKAMGMPAIVVNNAVIQYNWTTVLAQPTEDFESQFRSCVLHNVLMAKAFIPAMVEQKYGRFIGINTECAMQNLAGQAAYVAGKRGMDGVMKILAREVGEFQITVNQVSPGWTISDRDRDAGTERNEGYESRVALRRRGTDQEIANVVAFLASDLASFVTGANIPVCGGLVMPGI